jgi:hypothetical protein
MALPRLQTSLLAVFVTLTSPIGTSLLAFDSEPRDAKTLLAVTPKIGKSGDWSPYDPIRARPAPNVDNAEWSRRDLDRFVYARLRDAGLEPAPAVDRRVWLRRVSFDLTGLPPSAVEMEAFLGDKRADDRARAVVVDRLLASFAYGERMARHWLDVARYADTDGFAIDGERATLWRYRDYVVRVFNEDRPIDRFIREQIAGDEIEGAGTEGLVATGFFRLGPWEADNMVPEIRRQNFLDEVTSSTGLVFLGLTIGCARCHDHKYDPVPTRDYYSLQAFLTPVDRGDKPAELEEREVTPAIIERSSHADRDARRREGDFLLLRHEFRQRLAAKLGKPYGEIADKELEAAIQKSAAPFTKEDAKRHKKLEERVKKNAELARFAAVACTVSMSKAKKDTAAKQTHVLLGGDVTRPGERVDPGFLSAVSWKDDRLGKDLTDCRDKTVGRRRVLAEWLASSKNPLTPRVFVNRLWQHTIGVGIVATSNDFGVNGSGASHPGLLDALTRHFLDGGWRVKPILRGIVLSRSYRTSLVHPRAAHHRQRDPENRLLWRGHHRRLDADEVRDALLAVSGRLNREDGGPGFYVKLPREMETKYAFFEWNASSELVRRRRSLFIFRRRNLAVPMLAAFDAPDSNEPCERRGSSVTTPQVFALFNGDFAHEASRALAMRALDEAGLDRQAQIERVFLHAFGRHPTTREASGATRLVEAQLARHRAAHEEALGKAGRVRAEIDALGDLCLVVLNANEFVYLE